ncbi:Uncharacterized Nudix hydrolase NudL [hydrothermal vent metagenome]|uniref:Uncharacterized Nudix hydrolase NudL n=1 Tax=hydrothermal vent metagenome TaxID=652676 RepID=A0A3B0UFI9_9ZZZZ
MQEEDGFLLQISQKLLKRPLSLAGAEPLVPDWMPDVPFIDPPAPAAVLISLVARPGGRTIIYTQRSAALRAHSGQIAFPGGKIDASDVDAGATALREAHEEVGLELSGAKILGYMPPYQTGTNYVITPVVAAVCQRGRLVPNPNEVDEVFEVPLEFIMDKENYGRFLVTRPGREHSSWMLDFDGHIIWGITAHLTRKFRKMILGEPDWPEPDWPDKEGAR